MEQITNYVKPELIVVAIALYFVGMALKQAQAVKDKYIPLILGGISIVICAIYVFATCTCGTGQDIAMAIFTAITQGILIAGLSTYDEFRFYIVCDLFHNHSPFLSRSSIL